MQATEIYNKAIEQYYKAQSKTDKKAVSAKFEIAAEMGVDLAMLRAGEMHLFGDGVKTSKTIGRKWVLKACEKAEHHNDLYIQDPKDGIWLDAKKFLDAIA